MDKGINKYMYIISAKEQTLFRSMVSYVNNCGRIALIERFSLSLLILIKLKMCASLVPCRMKIYTEFNLAT